VPGSKIDGVGSSPEAPIEEHGGVTVRGCLDGHSKPLEAAVPEPVRARTDSRKASSIGLSATAISGWRLLSTPPPCGVRSD
jgi:hypothetical protein